jgi:prepilin-type N-terminal cleavage/methylation domain-containing protein/prepilin-type processing-associated H-X9-DG protein
MIKSSPPSVERAFTLIELLVVIATITILVAIALPVFNGVLERGKAMKDLSNLRQIGVATQMYMNDNNGVLFSTGSSWMTQLNPKYISRWAVLQSPFDKRPGSEAGTASPVSPISYGINSNVFSGSVPFSADKITKPSSFILFAPAQKSGTTVSFQGTAVVTLPVVTVLGIGGNTAASNPGGNATGGTHNNRTKINALFADLHSETMSWATFTNNAATSNDPDGLYRWTP